MKKTLAAITTAVLAVGIVVAGVTGAASADTTAPSDTTTDVAASTAATSTEAAAPEAPAPAPEAPAPAAEAPAPAPAEPAAAPAPESAPVQNPEQSSEPAPASKTSDVAAPESTSVVAPTCISNPTFSYTYVVDRGTVTASKDGVTSGTLCTPLYIRAVTWSYDLPVSGENPSWPQSLVGTDDVLLDSLGTVSYQAPVVATCKQNDIYASFGGWDALEVPTKLTAPFTPHEPEFLHNVFGDNHGPTPTYYSTPSVGCTQTTGPVAPVTFVDVCGTANDKVNIPTGTVGYGYVTDDKRDANGVGTVTVTAVPDKGYSLPDGPTSWSHTFLGDAANNCVTLKGDPTASPQVCNLANPGTVIAGVITVVATPHITYTIHNTDTPSRAADVTVTDGSTSLPVGTYEVTAVPDEGFTLTNEPATTTHTIVDQAIDCPMTKTVAIDPSVSATDQLCRAGNTVGGSITVDPTDGLTYFVGDRQLTAATTSFAPGTYSVRAVAPEGDTVLGANPVSVTIAAAAFGCATFVDFASLALTGAGSGTALFLIIAALLLLVGAVLVSATRIRAGRGGSIN